MGIFIVDRASCWARTSNGMERVSLQLMTCDGETGVFGFALASGTRAGLARGWRCTLPRGRNPKTQNSNRLHDHPGGSVSRPWSLLPGSTDTSSTPLGLFKTSSTSHRQCCPTEIPLALRPTLSLALGPTPTRPRRPWRWRPQPEPRPPASHSHADDQAAKDQH